MWGSGEGRRFLLIRSMRMFGHEMMERVQDEPRKGTGRWKHGAGRSQPGLRGNENNLSRTQRVQGRLCFYTTEKKLPGSKDVVDEEKDYAQTTILFLCPSLLHFPYLKSCITIFFFLNKVWLFCLWSSFRIS